MNLNGMTKKIRFGFIGKYGREELGWDAVDDRMIDTTFRTFGFRFSFVLGERPGFIGLDLA
jgi:hypothetical protein